MFLESTFLMTPLNEENPAPPAPQRPTLFNIEVKTESSRLELVRLLEPAPPTLPEVLLAARQGHLGSLRPLDGPG
jgi:hypothetical protein